MKIHWGLIWIQNTWDKNHMKSKLRTLVVDGEKYDVLFPGNNSATKNKVVAIMESACGADMLAPPIVDILYWDAESTPQILRGVPVSEIWDVIEVIERGGKSKYYVKGGRAWDCGSWYDQDKVFEAIVY